MAHLLEYLCFKYFDGQADSIKEYNIAVEVLGRPESFDPAEDAIARVEVHRLRRKLREYYESDGLESKLRIVIPSGHYVPIFVPAESGPSRLASPMGEETRSAKNAANGTTKAQTSIPYDAPQTLPLPQPSRGPSWLMGRPWISAIVLSAAGVVIIGLFWLRSRPVATAAPPTNRFVSPSTPMPVSGAGSEARILCGQRKPHTDRLGHVWGPDRYFNGGSYAERPRLFMTRTLDPQVFQNARSGDFSYDVPLQPGVYELHLYFAETVYGPGTSTGGGENNRVFNVMANGTVILNSFDIVSDAGGALIADERVFKDISPGRDGFLHLSFLTQRAQAIVSAIEIVRSHARHQNPIRIYTQENSYTDSNGFLWGPDNYWSGGQTAIHGASLQGTRDPDLFARERYGNFSYAIPADQGEYAVSLYLTEGYWGAEEPNAGGEGRRLFDVYCNGVALLRDFDIFKEAGGAGRALIKTFHGLRPNAQGKLLLSFVPVRNYASVYAIEVVDETR